ncbi:MAG: TraR/DksA family transcriptional regulator [Gammaproteobacteria bacterium]
MAALTTTQAEALKAQLKSQYRDMLRDIREGLDNAGDTRPLDLTNHEPGDSGDEAVANELADINVASLQRHIRAARDIEDAFKRFKAGAYGVCIDCGDAIAFARLRAFPTAKRCLACQQRHEQHPARDALPGR